MIAALALLVDGVIGRRIDPAAESAALPPGVTLRRGTLIPAIGGICGRMRGPAAAVTLGRTIVFHPGAAITPRLLAHELEHVRQWAEVPWFPVRYVLESARRGYRQNRFEVAARDAETRPNRLFSHPG